MSLRLPGEFFSSSSLPSIPDSDYVTRLKQYMGTLRATPARNPLSRNSFIDDSLSSTSYVFIFHDAVKKPLQQLYLCDPFRVLSHTDKYFHVDINGKQDTVSIDCLKSAHIDHSNTTLPCTLSPDVTPITPPTTTAPTVTPSTTVTRTRSGRQVHFPTRLIYRLSFHWRGSTVADVK